MESSADSLAVYALGHSTRTWDDFLALLAAHRIELLADVRTVPGSRAHPHFSKEHLARKLPRAGVRYAHLPGLGGLRKPREFSENAAWENLAFRGYADHMQTPEFEAAVEELLALAAGARTAIMCAEGNPFRCHRTLLADALTARGVRVLHIASRKSAAPHRMTSFARVDGHHVTYPKST